MNNQGSMVYEPSGGGGGVRTQSIASHFGACLQYIHKFYVFIYLPIFLFIYCLKDIRNETDGESNCCQRSSSFPIIIDLADVIEDDESVV